MFLNRRFKNLLGRTLHIPPDLPRGSDLFHDLRTALPQFHSTLILDVGAHLGQSATQYLHHFPAATIHCVEPLSTTFHTLQATLGKNPRIHCHRTALAAASGTGTMLLAPTSDTARLLHDTPPLNTPIEQVPLTTLETFCHDHTIPHISFLKIDAEGSDLDILTGAAAPLRTHAIDLLQVEAGINPGNTAHIPLDSFRTLLEPHGYRLFALYDQTPEFPTRQPHLRRLNAVFLSPTLYTPTAQSAIITT